VQTVDAVGRELHGRVEAEGLHPGDTVVVGAYGEHSARAVVSSSLTDPAQSDRSALVSGAAYVFVRRAGAWSQQACLKASNTDSGDSFGHSLAIDRDTIVVGAGQESSAATGVDNTTPGQADNSAAASGAAYVFARTKDAWSQQAYLKASNAEAGDWFNNVDVTGDTIVVGACGESSAARGINSTSPGQGDNSAEASGAVYVFGRTGATWSQVAYLKASNADAGDRFCVVAASRDTIAVGAAYESSATVGTNNSPPGSADNSVAQSGAVYVFR
jgi:trimeric autotransporter adhesin